MAIDVVGVGIIIIIAIGVVVVVVVIIIAFLDFLQSCETCISLHVSVFVCIYMCVYLWRSECATNFEIAAFSWQHEW